MDKRANVGQQLDWVAVGRSLARWFGTHRTPFLMTMPLASLALFALMFHFLCRYQSDGFLRASRPLTEFNAQRASFEDKGSLLRYLQANKLVSNPAAQYLLNEIGPALMLKQVRPVLPYSRDDLRFLTDLKSPVDANLLGFTISFTAASPEDAAARVKLMGDYLRDVMLRQDLLENIHIRAGEAKGEKQKIDNKLIAKRLELEEATSRLNAIKAIAAKYPEASKFESRQLLSSDSDSSKYLSPVMQLVGVESNIADLRIEIASLERDAAQNALRLQFYLRAERQLSTSAKAGKGVLDDFKGLQAEAFKGMNLEDDQVREVTNRISLLAEGMETKHLVNARFVSGPTVPDRRSGPGIVTVLFLALMGGCLVAAAAVTVLDWLRGGKARRSLSAVGEPRIQF